MTEPLTDQDEHLLAELTTEIAEKTKRVRAGVERIHAALERLDAAAEAIEAAIDHLQRNHRHPLWPIVFLTGGLGGAVAALVVALLLS